MSKLDVGLRAVGRSDGRTSHTAANRTAAAAAGGRSFYRVGACTSLMVAGGRRRGAIATAASTRINMRIVFPSYDVLQLAPVARRRVGATERLALEADPSIGQAIMRRRPSLSSSSPPSPPSRSAKHLRPHLLILRVLINFDVAATGGRRLAVIRRRYGTKRRTKKIDR